MRARGGAAARPEWVAPQLTQLVDAAPGGDEWLHEIEYEGYRMHVRLDRGAATISASIASAIEGWSGNAELYSLPRSVYPSRLEGGGYSSRGVLTPSVLSSQRPESCAIRLLMRSRMSAPASGVVTALTKTLF
jgi:hypothetical protein